MQLQLLDVRSLGDCDLTQPEWLLRGITLYSICMGRLPVVSFHFSREKSFRQL